MTVSFYNFDQLHSESLRRDVLKKFSKIFNENTFISGSYNHSFERKFALKQKALKCLLVGNGTDALELALKASHVKHGDRVGVPSVTFFATTEAVLNVGAIPVFIDVDLHTGLIDLPSLQRMVKKYPLKAIIPVHLYGNSAPIKGCEDIVSSHNIAIIEDAAQAQGGYYASNDIANQMDHPIGSSKNLTIFSFYPTKNLGAFGDAGAILTQSEVMADKIASLRNHGRGSEEFLGRNSRCDSLQACVLDHKIQYIDAQNERRKEIARQYYIQLENLPLKVLPKSALQQSSWHLFPILLKDCTERIALIEYMASHKIECVPFYKKTQHDIFALKDFKGEWKMAREWTQRVLCIPLNPFLSEENIHTVMKTLKKFYDL